MPSISIGVLGAGAIGSYYAAKLALAGHEVRLLARGPHLEAVRERGLEVRAPDDSFVARLTTTDDGEAMRGVEYALVAVKSYALTDVAPAAAACAAAGATVVSLLNGVDIAERLGALGVPLAAQLGGLAQVSLVRTAPGTVERRSAFDRVVVGELAGGDSERASRLADALAGAGVEARASADIRHELWRKFAFLVPMMVACGLTRGPVGPVLASPAGRELITRALREIVAVSRAAGHPLSDADEAATLHQLLALPAPMKPSFLLDLERGGPTELDTLAGTVARLGRELGVPTPVHEVATLALGLVDHLAWGRRPVQE